MHEKKRMIDVLKSSGFHLKSRCVLLISAKTIQANDFVFVVINTGDIMQAFTLKGIVIIIIKIIKDKE
jgi:hypothetical protein